MFEKGFYKFEIGINQLGFFENYKANSFIERKNQVF